MTSIGYALSSEEWTPQELVDEARMAEAPGFEFALVSDHFHPWLDEQGESPFVWTVLGAIAEATERIPIGKWEGGLVTHRGKHYTVDRARLYTVPDEPPPIAIAAAAENAAELAGRVGDALVSTAPDADVVKAFEQAGGKGKPKYGQFHVCVADGREQAVETAYRCWRNGALPGELGQELPPPRTYRQATSALSKDQVAEAVLCGSDPGPHREKIEEFADAGFDRVYVHQVGSDQEAFMRLYEREVLSVAVR
jgi:coenzyme F420-dependent glucose-6-phosphate dehydrogenase